SHLVVFRVAHRQDDDRNRRPPAQPTDHVDAVDAGQPEVEHHDVGMMMTGELQRLLAVGCKVDFVPARAEVDRQRAQDLRLVVDDETSAHACVAAGMRITIVTPPPGVSSISISPPMASTKPRATASPRPTPLPFERSPRRWNGRKTASR